MENRNKEIIINISYMYILASYLVKKTTYELVVLYIINNNKIMTFSKKGQILYAYNKTQTFCTQPPAI